MNQFNQFQAGSISQQLSQVEQIVQQIAQQTQQATMQYQQLLQQEQNNAATLQQIAQREQHAAQVIQTALQGHQKCMQQLNQISGLCNQIASSSIQHNPAFSNINNQSASYSGYTQH